MDLELYGGPKHGGWSAHGEHQQGLDTPLRPCPFCGSEDLELSNTHTPYYAARCNECGTEGPTPRMGDAWNRRMGRAATERLHREAFQAAVRAWNKRAE